MLHDCGGFSSHNAEVADRIGSWDYVALAVDSLEARGIADRCGIRWLPDQPFDAYAALRYLSQLDFVEASRVAVAREPARKSAIIIWANDCSPQS